MEKQVKLSVHSQVSCVMRIFTFAYAKIMAQIICKVGDPLHR